MKSVTDKKLEPCNKLYSCPRMTMAPMIRALLRCTAEEAMINICTSCEDKQAARGRKKDLVSSKV